MDVPTDLGEFNLAQERQQIFIRRLFWWREVLLESRGPVGVRAVEGWAEPGRSGRTSKTNSSSNKVLSLRSPARGSGAPSLGPALLHGKASPSFRPREVLSGVTNFYLIKLFTMILM